MNANSIAKIIEKKLHLVRSKDNKKLQQRVGRNNIGNGYYTIHDFVGDFRVKKYLDDWRDTDLYRVYLDSGKAINMIDDIVDVLNNINEVNIEFINKNSIDFTFKNLEESLKESTDDIFTVKEFCFWGHSGNIVEIWTIDGVLCDAFEVRHVGKSEYKDYEIHGWDCAKNTVIIYIKK